MKVVLVYQGGLTRETLGAFEQIGYRLAEALHRAGLLGTFVCRMRSPDLDLPRDVVLSLYEEPFYRFCDKLVSRLARWFRTIPVRRFREWLFDRYLTRRLSVASGDILFCSRPLYPDTIARAKARGATVWVQSSVPHPLLNYALVHNEEISRGLMRLGAYTDIKRVDRLASAIAQSDKILTLSPDIAQFTYDSYASFVGTERILPLRKFFVVDLDRYASAAQATRHPDQEGMIFLHVSYMNLIKGVPYLLDAWRRLKEGGDKHSRLILAGRLDHNLQQLIDGRYRDLPAVEYRGFVPDLVTCLQEADVFVSPSIADAGPTTIVEAMSAGLPVVVSLNCGFASLVTDGVDGFTYTYNDTEELTRHLKWCADHPDAIQKMGDRARSRSEQLSIDGYVDELLALMIGQASK